MKIDLLKVVEDSFSTYAAMTIQERAIVDVRDCIKPAARQCMYAQLLDKITYKKPFKKSNKSVASALDHFYIHGDSSCYALLTRMAKNFAMRYPLEDFDGSSGTISSGNSEAASRYTEMRLGELGCLLFQGIDKDCIDVWFDNYDNTEQFPSVVPSLGYYNICNGAMGIATGLATSIPQYNLKEVNNALIKLLWNPNIDFDEIYCPPDFCTGATILNADEVKQSHKDGCGRAAIIRSTIEYNPDENCLYVTEIPYGVYAQTICKQIESGINSGEIIGIKNLLDLSTKKANIKIVLEKNINVQKLIKQLYKLTALQSSYTINLVMLDNGNTPKTFTWKEALQAHLDHEVEVRTKIHKYDLQKIAARINIIEGSLLAIANIEEVVEIIKGSSNKEGAKIRLIDRFGFNEAQVDAILKMTLSRLINLEVQSFKDEKNKLEAEAASIQSILDDKNLLFKEIEDGLKAVAEKFGDDRRTRLMNLDYKEKGDDVEPIEEKQLLIYYTNLGNIYTQESSTLVTTRRGGKGSKIKMGKNEVVIKTLSDTNVGSLLAFTNKGKMYSIYTNDLPINAKINCNQLFAFENGEKINTLTTINRRKEVKYFIFVTKNGLIKKTKSSEYDHKRGKSIKAINLKDDDEVVNVLFVNNEKVGVLTNTNNFVIIETETINSIGRAAAGVKAIKLDNSYVIDCKVIGNEDTSILSITKNGLCKKTSIEEYGISSRGIKGTKIMKTEDDSVTKFLSIEKDTEVIVVSTNKMIKVNSSEFRLLGKNAIGIKSISLEDNCKVVDFLKEALN